VLNNSRVIPARLHGVNAKTGGQFEILLLEENSVNDWWAMLRPGKRAPIWRSNQNLNHNAQPTEILATVTEVNDEGHRRLQFLRCTKYFSMNSMRSAKCRCRLHRTPW